MARPEHSTETAMSLKSPIMPAALAALLVFGAAQSTSLAQTRHPVRPHARIVRHAPPRIVVTPGRRLYRRCDDWYVLQYRPSGTVLFPEYRCWWVRGPIR
jgi:hypothetical protein